MQHASRSPARQFGTENVLTLLAASGVDVNFCGDDAHRWTLLHFACQEGDHASLERCFDACTVPTVHAVNGQGDTALTLLLKVRLCALCTCWCAARPHAARAAQMNHEHVDVMAGVLMPKSDLNRVDADGNAAIHLAIKAVCRGAVRVPIAWLSWFAR